MCNLETLNEGDFSIHQMYESDMHVNEGSDSNLIMMYKLLFNKHATKNQEN